MYEESIHLYTSAAEAEMCRGKYEQMKVYTDTILNMESIELIEKMPVYETLLSALLAQKRVSEAWDLALQILDKAGARFVKKGTKARTAMSIAKLKLSPKQWKPEALANLPVSEEPMDEEISKVHDKLIELALMVHPRLFPLAIFTAVQHVIDRGLTRYSASVLSWFGVLLCGVLGDFQWGESNLKFVYSLLDRFENRLIDTRVVVVSTLNVAHWTSPIHELGSKFISGYAKGMETSDLVTAFWGAYYYHEVAFCSGTNLTLLAEDATLYSKQMEDYGMFNHLQDLRSMQRLISELRGLPTTTTTALEGESLRASIPLNGNTDVLQNHFVHATNDRLLGAAFLGNWKMGAELGMTYVEMIGKVLLGQFSSVVCRFITSLCCFEMARRRHHGSHQKQYHKVAMKSYKAIQNWCNRGNPNTQHYLLFLKAERAGCKGKVDAAVSLYRQAILCAGRSGFNHDQALACERLASLYTRMGDGESAKYCLEDALKLYEEWGAMKKVELLKVELEKLNS
jgi:tetratricopeptide (TPR) repeat protein